MSRPVRPTRSIATLGLHTLEFTWCNICHAMIKVTLLGASDPGGVNQAGMDLVEDMHYNWHEKEEQKLRQMEVK